MLRPNLFVDLGTSLESATPLSTEAAEVEIEHVLFARLSNVGDLKNAISVEKQVQYEYRIIDKNNVPKGTLRSREINNGEKYILCIKTYREDRTGVDEIFDEVSDDMHQAIGLLADRYLEKTRYSFPVKVVHQGEELDLKFEVDVFKNKDGQLEDLVKIDFEVPSKDITLPELPFNVEELIDTSFGQQLSPEDRATIDAFFDRVAIPVK